MVANKVFGQVIADGEKPSFFKILRREDLSSEIFRMIPRHFVRSISDGSYRMVLKVPWGSSWPVKVSKNPDFHYMEYRGWNQFVNDNALGENEFLTFTHEGNMCFNVNIFESNGKEMLRPRNSGQNKRELRKNIYKEVKEEEMYSSSESRDPSLTTAGFMKQKRELNLKKKKAEETEKSKKSKTKNDYEASASSLVPEFELTIKKSHLLFLGIPKKFKEMHMPNETRTFKIHHPKGNRSWEVTYVAADVQPRFSSGWSRLARELGLVLGDICTFKLIKPTEISLKVSKNDDDDDEDDDDDVCEV